MEKNPFEVLGMDSGIVRKLNDVQIVELAKGQYRTLAGFYHPDKGGKEEDFREIAEAYRTFDNFPKERELFRFWKEKHLKRTGLKKKAGELEEALDAARKGQVVLIEQLGEYLAQYAFGKTAFCTRGREFSMQDYANSLNLSSFVKGTCSRDLLFYKLRENITSLDESVIEEPKAKYIAYKTSTNFVDVVIKVSSLKIFLNMKSGQLEDPEGLARDLTKPKPIGHWGNGDYEVKIEKESDLEKVFYLINQSYNYNK